MKYLGFVVSADGIEVSQDRMACVRDWPYPASVTDLRKFLGFANYHRMFIQGFSKIAEPLNAMLRKEECVEPTAERLASFAQLKECLTSAPVLALPCDGGSYVVDTDACAQGLGCCLSQYQEGKLRPIEFASRSLLRTERHYCSTRLELLGFIFALRQFRHYLIGMPFQVRVDNMALTYLLKTPEPSGQTARYLDLISQYDFKIVYRPGKVHINCDTLSRLKPCEEDSGGPCQQCAKRVTGTHFVQALHSRPRREPKPPQCSCCREGEGHRKVRPVPVAEVEEEVEVVSATPAVPSQPEPPQPVQKKKRLEPVRPILPSVTISESKWSAEELSAAQSADEDVGSGCDLV